MKKKALITCIISIPLVCYTALAAYVISNQEIEDLLICADKGGLNIPFARNLCRSYLLNFRGNRDDIDTLHAGIGASFAVQGQSPAPEREQVLKFLISKGLDVNRINRNQLTPLHGSVVINEPDEVAMLIRNGASVNMKDKKFGLTPLELALKLKKEGKIKADYGAVITLLHSAEPHPKN